MAVLRLHLEYFFVCIRIVSYRGLAFFYRLTSCQKTAPLFPDWGWVWTDELEWAIFVLNFAKQNIADM